MESLTANETTRVFDRMMVRPPMQTKIKLHSAISPKIQTRLALLMGALLLFGSNPAWAASPISVKLTVTEPAGISRTQEPVTLGIPIGQSYNVMDVASLRITAADGTTSLPAQFTVLSRWGGLATDTTKPINWVQTDFEADVPASTSATFYLKNDGSYAPTGMAATTSSAFTVNTGAATFTISRTAFNLFDQVNLGGGMIISSPANDGFVYTDKNGTSFYASKGSVLDSSVEMDGPIQTIVMVHGKLSSGSANLKGGDASTYLGGSDTAQNYDLEYRVRFHFYKSKSYVIAENTLINDGNGFIGTWSSTCPNCNNSLYAQSMTLNTTLSIGSSHQITFQGYGDTTTSSTDSYQFLQAHSVASLTSETPNFSYSSTKNGGAGGTGGTRAVGYADLGDGSNGVTVAVKYFWQLYPKGFRINNTTLSADLLPQTGSNHFVRGGWHVTNELLYNFHTGSFSSSGAAATVSAYQSPVDARFDPNWFADTQAWGLDAPAGLTMPTPDLVNALNRWEQLQRAKVDATQSSNGASITTFRENRMLLGSANTWDHAWYGWDAFGDRRWKFFSSACSGAGCNLTNTPYLSGVQYDWPFSLLLHYLRTGNRGFYDMWMDMSNHNVGFAVQYGGHLSGEAGWFPNQVYWEDGGPFSTTSTYTGLMEQNQGFCLSYLYTGNKRFLDACKAMADEGWTYWTSYESTAPNYIKSELRIAGWNIFRQLNYYKVSGDATYLNQALTIFTNGLLATEQSAAPPTGIGSNGQGYVYDDLAVRDCTTQDATTGVITYQVRVLMLGYITDPLTELHRLSGSQAVLDFLTRMLNFVQTTPYVGGVTDSSGNYLPNQTPYCYNPATGSRQFRDIQVIYNYFFAGGYSYLYATTRNSTHLNFARSLFKDSVFYWEAVSNTYVNPTSLTPVYLGYEPQTSKQQGWTGRFHQGYLSMEYQMQKNGGVLPSWYPGTPPVPVSSGDTTPPAPPTGLKVQ
ncbi:MAG: hypothetical protein HY283_10570 [Nitrospirae bacterium]|nr:hypothetical protein [Nitrospirota bacterium]